MIKIYAILAILAILASGGYYVNTLVKDLEIAKASNVKLTTAVDAQEKTIKSLNLDFTLAKELNTKLREVQNSQQKEIANLNKKFTTKANGEERHLGFIARSKSGLTTGIINRATQNVNRCFELATGAKKLQGEMNNECKELIK